MYNPRSFAIAALTSALFATSALAEYNPVLGRFLQRDPVASGLPVQNDPTWFHGQPPRIGDSIFDARQQYADGMNLYQYVGGNPVTRSDPLGLEWDDFDEAIGGLYQDRLTAYGYTRDALGHAKRGSFLAQLYAHMAFAWDDFVWDQNEAILFDLIAGPFFSTICFVEGTPIATPEGPQPIECLVLGHEITSKEDPQHAAPKGPDLPPGIDAISLVRMEYCHADGSTTTMEVIRPSRLVGSLRLAPGCSLPVSLPEMGLAGDAHVLAVEPYHEPIRRDVPVVTGRFVTDAAEIVNVYVEGFARPIGVTPKHPMFSADRNTWVASSELLPGERLMTLWGIAAVTCVEQTPARAKVYNVEVSRYHTYFVGDAAVWAHNPCQLTQGAQRTLKSFKESGQLAERSFPALRKGSEIMIGESHFDVINSFRNINFSSWESGWVRWVNGEWLFRVNY